MSGSRVNKKKIVIAVTGSFGSGKSTVAGLFRRRGAEVIDADKIAHKVIQPKTKVYRKIVSVFGRGALKKDLKIDRDKLGKKVFADKILLSRLNKIVHPAVIRVIREKLKQAPKKLVVLDVPLLIEANLAHLVDKIIVVNITRKKQIKRITERRSLGRADILKRINAQVPLSDKVRLADFIIDNNGTISQTKKQVKQIWEALWKN